MVFMIDLWACMGTVNTMRYDLFLLYFCFVFSLSFLFGIKGERKDGHLAWGAMPFCFLFI